ncbi:MAG: hypothetical protein JWM59_258 [Verrucomicrobiales bacterium]|nr:hypothetical protein [Verrucomicrobiales bacterium]
MEDSEEELDYHVPVDPKNEDGYIAMDGGSFRHPEDLPVPPEEAGEYLTRRPAEY